MEKERKKKKKVRTKRKIKQYKIEPRKSRLTVPKVSGQITFSPIAQSDVTHCTTMQMMHQF